MTGGHTFAHGLACKCPGAPTSNGLFFFLMDGETRSETWFIGHPDKIQPLTLLSPKIVDDPQVQASGFCGVIQRII